MQLLTPGILEDAAKLSLPPLAVTLLAGLVLWALGWRTHRFWVVLVATVVAGVFGLYQATEFHAQPVLTGLLLAAAAGVLALHLVRLVAFLAGGCAGVLLLTELSPSSGQAPLVFLVAGLCGLLLFRFWIMALTSFSGSLLMSYAALALLHRSGSLNVLAWSAGNAGLLNGSCGLLTVIGVAVQYLLDRRRGKSKDKKSGKSSGSREGEFVLALPLLGWPKEKRKAG